MRRVECVWKKCASYFCPTCMPTPWAMVAKASHIPSYISVHSLMWTHHIRWKPLWINMLCTHSEEGQQLKDGGTLVIFEVPWKKSQKQTKHWEDRFCYKPCANAKAIKGKKCKLGEHQAPPQRVCWKRCKLLWDEILKLSQLLKIKLFKYLKTCTC
jgi:hypothetical protein